VKTKNNCTVFDTAEKENLTGVGKIREPLNDVNYRFYFSNTPYNSGAFNGWWAFKRREI